PANLARICSALSTVVQHRAGDRAAVIAVAGQAMVVQGLTGDVDSARRRVTTELPKAEGSRLDLGLAAAGAMLAASPAASARQVVELLTDGDLNQTPGDALSASVVALRDQGVALRVVLFDPKADGGLWRRLAGRSDVVGTFEALGPRRLTGSYRCR
ncbi:MAG: VWA domain-containing protein, partial [Anaerolineae bacterium]